MEDRLVLVVEDEDDMIWTVQKVMEKVSYQTLTAKSGEEGIQKALDRHPKVILLDIGLPDMNGFEVCRVIKSRPETENIKVILITGMPKAEVFARGGEAGADYFVPKPFFADDLAVDLYFMFDRRFSFTEEDRDLLRLARPIPRKTAQKEPAQDVQEVSVRAGVALKESVAEESSHETVMPPFHVPHEGAGKIEDSNAPPSMEKMGEKLLRDIQNYHQMLEVMTNRLSVLENRLNHFLKSHYHP